MMAMAGEPFYVKRPKIWGVKLVGELPEWVSAKDVILEMLRRHDVDGGLDKIVEYYGPGLKALSAMDRHVIANMGAELGATTTVFPSDDAVRAFLKSQGREDAFREIVADDGAEYDEYEEIDLSELEPLIALPSSPGKVVPVREVAGREIYQSYIGSSANPGLRDFAIAALMVEGKQVHDRVSFDVNPTSRQILENMIAMGTLGKLASTRRAAAAASAWGRRRPPGASACAPCRGIFPAARAPKRIRSICAARKPPPPRP
jgi:aconitate hydratase